MGSYIGELEQKKRRTTRPENKEMRENVGKGKKNTHNGRVKMSAEMMAEPVRRGYIRCDYFQGRAEKFRAPPQLPGFTDPGPKVGS